MEGSSTSSGVVLVLLSSLNQKKSPKCSLLLSSKPYFSNFPRPNWREKKILTIGHHLLVTTIIYLTEKDDTVAIVVAAWFISG